MRKNGKKAFILGTDTHTWLRPLIRRIGNILAYLFIGPLMRRNENENGFYTWEQTCILGPLMRKNKTRIIGKGFHTWEQTCKPDEGWSGIAPCPRLCTATETVLKISKTCFDV